MNFRKLPKLTGAHERQDAGALAKVPAGHVPNEKSQDAAEDTLYLPCTSQLAQAAEALLSAYVPCGCQRRRREC